MEQGTEGAELKSRLAQVRLLAMDVDGVLTDGTFAYDNGGGEQKRFHVMDGLGLVLLRLQQIEVAWISGRKSAIVTRRAQELGVAYVVQGVRDKRAVLNKLSESLQIPLTVTAYIGDDWNDLPAFAVAGVRIAVANAAQEVLERADVVTRHSGGQGAVREVCEMLLEARGEREVCLNAYLKSLEEPAKSNEPGNDQARQ